MFVLSSVAGFYTGRSGQDWVGGDAFAFATREEAERKAALFNARSVLHGLVFSVEAA